MRLNEKAMENLEACKRLLPDDEFENDCLPNAAAARAYYAAYLAVADRALRNGEYFTASSRDYFRHDTLPQEARRWGILDSDGSEELELLWGLRIKADYQEDQVALDEASQAFDIAEQLVNRLLNGRD